MKNKIVLVAILLATLLCAAGCQDEPAYYSYDSLTEMTTEELVNAYNTEYRSLGVTTYQNELNKREIIEAIEDNAMEKGQSEEVPLEDRFADLMDSLSDNGTMKYDLDIEAELYSDGSPDRIKIVLHLKAGDVIGGSN